MLFEQFSEWKKKKKHFSKSTEEEINTFDLFFQESSIGKGFMEIFCDLAYQIHELQVCSEGFCQDFEGVFEDIDELLSRSELIETDEQKSIF